MEETDGSYEVFYESKKQREDGVMPKIGMQWSPWSLVTIGMALDQTFLINAPSQGDLSYHSTILYGLYTMVPWYHGIHEIGRTHPV